MSIKTKCNETFTSKYKNKNMKSINTSILNKKKKTKGFNKQLNNLSKIQYKK